MDISASIASTVVNKQTRKPRFKRAEAVRVQLQERDFEIIMAVFKHRFVSSQHLLALFPGSRQGVLRRLQLLYHTGYLDRPPDQLEPFFTGSRPIIYALGSRGADLLHSKAGMSLGKVDWAGKNRGVKQVYMAHTLMVADFMVCLELACRKHGRVSLIETEEIVRDRPALRVKTNFKFNGQVYYVNYTLEPDKLFGLQFLDAPEGSNRAFFLLEADRSTMPIRRTSPYKTCYEKKLKGYWECWKQGAFKQVFRFQNARVLTLAKSNERIDTMLSVCKDLDERARGSRMFLFLKVEDLSLSEPEKVLAPVWRNSVDDRLVSIVE